MSPHAKGKITRSVSNGNKDLDHPGGVLPESIPTTTSKRARGRPLGVGNKIAKPVPRATRGAIKRLEATVTAPARQVTVSQGREDAAAASLELEGVEPHYGTTRTRPRDDMAQICSEVNNGSQKRLLGNIKRLKAGESVAVEPTTRSAGCLTMVEILDAQETAIFQANEREDETAVYDGTLTADLDATKPEDVCATNGLDGILVRRRLGDLTKRYENLEMRHRDLREVGLKAAERNFESLRKQAEENIAGR